MALDPNAPKGPPPRWGDDELTSFIQLAGTAGWGAFCNDETRKYFDRLRDIDITFLRVVTALNRPAGNLVEALMLLSAHSYPSGKPIFPRSDEAANLASR